MRPARPSIDRRWGIVATCILFQVASLGVTVNCFSFFVAGWSKAFHAPISELDLGFTLMNFALLFILPSIGRMCDRLSVRALVALGIGVTALLHVAVGLVGNAWELLALYGLVLPICVSLNGTIPAQTLVTRWFLEGRGFAMGIAAFGVQLAGVVLPPVVVVLLPRVGWRATWEIFAAAIVAVVLPIAWLVLRDWPARHAAGTEAAAAATAAAPPMSARAILAHRNVWVMAGAFLAVQIPFQALTINQAPLMAARGLDAGRAAAIAALMSVCAIAAKLAAGYASDRLGNRAPLVVTAVAVTAGVLVLVWARSFAAFAVGYALLGLSGAQWTLLASTTGAEFAPSTFGRAFGLISTFTPLCAIGPVALAALQEHAGRYGPGVAMLAVLSALGCVAAALYRQPKAPAAA